MQKYRLTIAAGLAAFVSTSAAAQIIATTAASTTRTGTAAVVSKPPLIDGKLDDDAWKSGQVYSDFVQRELREGDAVTERTEVRLLTDGDALYVGAWLFDRDPSGIVPGEGEGRRRWRRLSAGPDAGASRVDGWV